MNFLIAWKKGGNPINVSHADDFWEVVNYCELIDLGFHGRKYTWINKRFYKKEVLIFERLDCFFANNN